MSIHQTARMGATWSQDAGRGKRVFAFAGIAALSILHSALVFAHGPMDASLDNRVLLVQFTRGEVRLRYALFSARESESSERKVSNNEKEAVVRHLHDGLWVELDGRRVAVDFAISPEDNPSEDNQKDGPLMLRADVVISASQGNFHTIALRDDTTLARPGTSDVLLRELPGGHLLASWAGAQPGGRELEFSFHNPKAAPEERTVHLHFQTEPVRKEPHSVAHSIPSPWPFHASAKTTVVVGMAWLMGAASLLFGWRFVRRFLLRRRQRIGRGRT